MTPSKETRRAEGRGRPEEIPRQEAGVRTQSRVALPPNLARVNAAARKAAQTRFTDDLKARFNGDAGDGFLPMREAMRALGVSRQTVLQRVKRGELEAVHVVRGRQKGLRIKVIGQLGLLFDRTP